MQEESELAKDVANLFSLPEDDDEEETENSTEDGDNNNEGD